MKNLVKLFFISVLMFICFGTQNFHFIKANDKEITEVELNILNEMVYEKLGTDNYEYYLINNFKDINRYFLVEGNNCYLIYDRSLSEYIEFSRTSNSIYFGIESEKIYLGPGYYFYRDGNNVIDLLTEEILTTEQIHYYTSLENVFTNNFQANKNLYIEDNITTFDVRSSELPSSKYINNSFYFENLSENIGDNDANNYSGSCGYVALEMILSYYDTFLNDNIISDSYDVEVSKSFSSYNDISLVSFPESPGVDNNFHGYFIQFGINNGYSEVNDNSTYANDMDSLMSDYFEFMGLSVTTDETSLIENKINFCKTAINSNYPVLVSIRGTDTAIDPRDLSHAVVAYGYDETGIYVHFGWRNSPLVNVNINNYTIAHSVYFIVNESHVCSDNYEWSANGCTGTFCPCGIKTCNHETLNYEYRTSSDHIVSCNACNYSYIEEHDDLAYESITSTHHKVSCLTCEDYYYELHDYVVEGDIQTCTECGHQEEICYHENMIYENYTSAYHNVNCANCDYSYTEEHDIYVQDHTQYCSKCDYEHVLSVGHNYIYIPITGGKNHKKQCSICSSYTIEACIALGQVGSTTRTCALCGQTMNSNIGFVPLKKDEDEIVE